LSVAAIDYRGLDYELRITRKGRGVIDAGQFADAAFELIASRVHMYQATTDIPSIGALEHVAVCVLATSAIVKARPNALLVPESVARH
jgi:hypothetical protein